ncbi:MAG: hypothetical protein U5N86_03760 [Planctomycetota bacterium]|nr:hypothetical protein [Planctomycetota bacterium]
MATPAEWLVLSRKFKTGTICPDQTSMPALISGATRGERMTEANVDRGRASCPFCSSENFEIYRRQSDDSGLVRCSARCGKCDNTFVVVIDKYGAPVRYKKADNEEPLLPFDQEQ